MPDRTSQGLTSRKETPRQPWDVFDVSQDKYESIRFKSSELEKALQDRELTLDHKHKENIKGKLAIYLSRRHITSEQLDINTIADAITDIVTRDKKSWQPIEDSGQIEKNLNRVLNIDRRDTINGAIIQHNQRNVQIGKRLKREGADLEDRVPEVKYTTKDGKYVLVQLTTKQHFKAESAELSHCLGGTMIDHYLSRMINNKITAYSFRKNETQDKPIITIVYDKQLNSIIEIKKKYNELLKLEDPYFQQVVELIETIKKEKSIVNISDLRRLINEDQILTTKGNVIKANEENILRLSKEEILICSITITSDTSDSVLAKIQELPIDINASNATQVQINKIKKVQGNIKFIGNTSLKSLPKGFKAGGSVDIIRCTSLTSLPKGFKAGGSVWLRGNTSLTSLPQKIKNNVKGEIIGFNGEWTD